MPDENITAEMQMAMVRVCRIQRNAHGVWSYCCTYFLITH